MKPYRIGIVGAGFGVSAHLPALVAHPRFDVVALASPTTAVRTAAERGIPQAFASCAEMLRGCDLDAVTIASPPFAHERDVLDALTAGKHVMCEKPFGLNVASAKTMLDASARAGTACGIAHEFRFVPQAQALFELVANHHLDPLRNVEITLLSPRLRRNQRTPRRWWFEREKGGGIAGASLSHLVDQANWLMGRPPARTAGFLRTANPLRHDEAGEFASSVDDAAFALLDYGEGITARLTSDSTTSVESYTCALHGENRTAVASGPNVADVTLYTIDNDETSELTCKPSQYARLAAVNPNVPLLMELYDEFVKSIEGKPNALPTFQEALATQEVLAAIGYSVPLSP